MNMIYSKNPCVSTLWRRKQSEEKINEMNERRRDKINTELARLQKRYKDMTDEEKREYNHQRYLRHKDEYKARSKKQYEKLKSMK